MNATPTAPSILIADDQKDVVSAIRLLLKAEGYSITGVYSPSGVIKALEDQDFDVLLMDLNYARDTTSGQEGLELLRKIQELDSPPMIVVMTAWSSVELAVETMQLGARDFIQKPWDNARLLTVVRTQVELSKALRKGKQLEAQNKLLSSPKPSTFIAEAPSMRPVMEMIERVGPSDANVLITGENGTGKGVVAKALHERSLRAENPMITVNMGGLGEGVFESELFGHVKGAFTDAKADRAGRFELADAGTLFMDEIANVPMSQQRKMLRMLETGEFERVGSSRTRKADVRILSATNADLEGEVSEGKFRQDLLYRLNTIQIHIPPLRERQEDIPLLADLFLQRLEKKYRKNIEGLEGHAIDLLIKHEWPGNVRELDHAIERAVLMCMGSKIKANDLGLNANKSVSTDLDSMSIEDMEVFLIQKALTRNGGNASKAAETLGLSRSAFYRRLQRYGL